MELTIHREGNSDLISDDVETESFKKGSLPFAFFLFFLCVCVRESSRLGRKANVTFMLSNTKY